jgi:predicted transporter
VAISVIWENASMRNIVFGAIGVLWGGLILIGFMRMGLEADGASRAGQILAVILGLLMLIAGGYYLVTGIIKLQKPPPKRTKRRKLPRPRDDD